MDNLAYNKKSPEYFANARLEILDLLPQTFTSVIDVGGSSGATLSAIKKKWPSVRTICVDAHEKSIEIARAHGHEAILCDLEESMPDIFGACQVVLLLDVLEHLVDPWRQLARITSALPAGATVIVSLPNVRFWEASCKLFFLGKWKLTESGVLDKTHLRFFTHESGADMLRGAGLTIHRTRNRISNGRRYALINGLTLGTIKDFLTEQYIFLSRK